MEAVCAHSLWQAEALVLFWGEKNLYKISRCLVYDALMFNLEVRPTSECDRCTVGVDIGENSFDTAVSGHTTQEIKISLRCARKINLPFVSSDDTLYNLCSVSVYLRQTLRLFFRCFGCWTALCLKSRLVDHDTGLNGNADHLDYIDS